jgi:hypothetical protein
LENAKMRKHKISMMVASILLLGLFVFPMWSISIEAPQYPDPLGMNIWIHKIEDRNPNDIRNINILNHYVGMAEIPEKMKEFEIFPPVIIFMAVLGLLLGWKANYKWYLVWFIVLAVLGSVGMYDFYLWEYDYGHNLDPKAAIKFLDEEGNPMAYQPPLLGTKTILNFTAHSYPLLGAYFLFVGMGLSLLAFFMGKKTEAAQIEIKN